tara:strand:- start:513 stop:698 length:186 start_codon:yes stop_codon:yes gene_type:complete
MTKWWVERIFRSSVLIPREPLLPGRWQLKRNVENWMINHYPGPGYTNKELNRDENSKKSKS